MSSKRLISIIISCVLVISVTGCSCTNREDSLVNDKYITGDFSKINKDYIRDSGFVIGEYVVELPALVCEIPTNSNQKFYSVDNNKVVYSDSRIKPYQIINFNSANSFTTMGLMSNGTYYAYNDTESDNLADYCRVFAIYINMHALPDTNYLQIGNDRIDKNTSYSDACSIFRNNVISPDDYIENLNDKRGDYSVAYYNDLLYKIEEDIINNSFNVVIRIDKDISDATNLNDIPWGIY